MGLLKHLLFWPVTGPSYLTRFSLEKVEGAVRTEVTDDAGVKRELMELQMELELGDIDDDEYVAREAELMQKLRDVRHWREQFGMATSGGLVRVADDAGEDEEAPDDSAASGEARASDGSEDAGEEKRPSIARPESAEIDVVFGFDED